MVQKVRAFSCEAQKSEARSTVVCFVAALRVQLFAGVNNRSPYCGINSKCYTNRYNTLFVY